MESIIIYMVKASIALTLFYGLYLLCFRNDTFFRLRRIFFLFAIAFSLSFPFINLEMPVDKEEPVQMPMFWLSDIQVSEVVSAPVETTEINIWTIVFIIIAIISLVYALRFIIQMVSLAKLQSNSDYEYYRGYKIIKLKEKSVSPFSFFKWIFINKDAFSQKDLEEIIIHEQVHVRQFHFIDVLLSEILCICLWWNPFVWFFKRELKINLEYLADEGVLKAGINSKEYQYTLLQVSNNNTGISIINHFNVSQLKKRITMMNKKKTSIATAIKYLLAVPLGAVLLMGNAVQASSDMTPDVLSYFSDDEPLTVVEQMPSFPGGLGAYQKYLAKNLKYPVEAVTKKIQGNVVVRFTVKSTGDIADIKIIKGVDPLLDNEAIRVVKAMPKWESGKIDGKAVDAYYTLPISFGLTGTDTPREKSSGADNEVVVIAYGGGDANKTAVAQQQKPSKVHAVVEQMPSFPGGEAAMMQFIGNNLKYPVEEQEAGVEGKVILRFIISATGEISDVVAIRGVHPKLDEEAMRVIKAMPNWEPGKEKGKAVSVYFTLPIVYKLNKDIEKKKESISKKL